jgi:methyl-accepting chemotaxis protein
VSKLDGAIEALLEELQIQMNQVSETKRTINALLRRVGKEPQFAEEAAEQIGAASVRIRPDQYYGRALATSVRRP